MPTFTPQLRAANHGSFPFRRGGYAQHLPPESVSGLPAVRSRINFEDEIAHLRALFRHVALTGAVYDQPQDIAFILQSLCMAASAIARLVQLELLLSNQYGNLLLNDRLPAIQQAIQQQRARLAMPVPPPSASAPLASPSTAPAPSTASPLAPPPDPPPDPPPAPPALPPFVISAISSAAERPARFILQRKPPRKPPTRPHHRPRDHLD